jgi:hypothetical protein
VLSPGSTANLGGVTTRFAREDHQHVLQSVPMSAIPNTAIEGGGANLETSLGVIASILNGKASTTQLSSVQVDVERVKEAAMPSPIGPNTKEWRAQYNTATAWDRGWGGTMYGGSALTSADLAYPSVYYETTSQFGVSGVYGASAGVNPIDPNNTLGVNTYAARVAITNTANLKALWIGLFANPLMPGAVQQPSTVCFDYNAGTPLFKAISNAGASQTTPANLPSVPVNGVWTLDIRIRLYRQNLVLFSWRKWTQGSSVATPWVERSLTVNLNGPLKPAIWVFSYTTAPQGVGVYDQCIVLDDAVVR